MDKIKVTKWLSGTRFCIICIILLISSALCRKFMLSENYILSVISFGITAVIGILFSVIAVYNIKKELSIIKYEQAKNHSDKK
ncbi:hypothetical protein UT300012_24550 [Paraclostridium bifermentans]